MNEAQKKKFEEWWTRHCCYEGQTDVDLCREAWEACLDANKVEEQESEPSPTEMVRRLLEKGWKVHVSGIGSCWFESPRDAAIESLDTAYRKAFPRKKKIDVEVWIQQCPDNKHKVRETGYFGMAWDESWTKGTATFWVEEEQPCTSEDGLS